MVVTEAKFLQRVREIPARWLAIATIAGGSALSLCLNLPGHMSYDSVVQLAEGRNGDYGLSGHPPVMSWLLGIADQIVPGPAAFVVFDTVLISGALISLILLGRRPPWAAVAIALITACLPQLLIYPAIVWKDVLFAGAATAGFTSLACAAAVWAAKLRRTLLIVAGLTLLTLAAMARQNGAVVLPFAAGAIAWIAAIPPGRRRLARGALHGLLFLSVSIAVIVLGTAALTPPKVGPTAAVRGQVGNLQTYDIVRALALEPRTQLRVLHARAAWFEHLLRTDGVAAYSPVRIDSLQPIMETAGLHPDSAELIDAQWKDMVIDDPWLYARLRMEAFRWVMLTPDTEACVLVFTGIDGPPEEMAELGLTQRKSHHDDNLADYAMFFAGSPFYSHLAYGVLALGILVCLVRRRASPDIAVAAMLISGVVFSAAFAAISIACDYRYLYPLDISAISGLIYLISTWNGVKYTKNVNKL